MKKKKKIKRMKSGNVNLAVLLCIALLIGFSTRVTAAGSGTDNSVVHEDDVVIHRRKTVTGIVIDAKGEPVTGATIVEKGTTNGIMTNVNGEFSIDVDENAVMEISYIGYSSQAIPVAGKTTLHITLEEDTQNLEEIVVVGYSVQKRESLTGALQTLKSEKLTNITTPAVQNMLNGKVPGVYVAPGDGRPGSSGSIVIRGKTSINGETRPLWVIDGVIAGTNPNNSLNPGDIETMTILKDAASTAIYGSQGANGVIVVTTKKVLPTS